MIYFSHKFSTAPWNKILLRKNFLDWARPSNKDTECKLTVTTLPHSEETSGICILLVSWTIKFCIVIVVQKSIRGRVSLVQHHSSPCWITHQPAKRLTVQRSQLPSTKIARRFWESQQWSPAYRTSFLLSSSQKVFFKFKSVFTCICVQA